MYYFIVISKIEQNDGLCCLLIMQSMAGSTTLSCLTLPTLPWLHFWHDYWPVTHAVTAELLEPNPHGVTRPHCHVSETVTACQSVVKYNK